MGVLVSGVMASNLETGPFRYGRFGIHLQLAVRRQHNFKPRQRGRRRSAHNGPIRGETRSVAGACESFAFGVGDYTAQVGTDGGNGMETLFLVEQEEAASFDAGRRTD